MTFIPAWRRGEGSVFAPLNAGLRPIRIRFAASAAYPVQLLGQPFWAAGDLCMTTREWSYGDKVIHAGKPEWGVGQVTGASGAVHEGKPCQRVVVRFERAGVKTLSTAFAELRPASEAPSLAAAQELEAVARGEAQTTSNGSPAGASRPGFAPEGAGWLNQAEAPSPIEVMSRLPAATNDPFTPLSARLKAMIDLYRFTDSGSSLLDWAAAQSGLKDPLSHFSRHELEQLFKRFTFVRDDHLKKIVLEMKKHDPATMQQMLKAAPPPVQQALKRLDVGR
jgi:hypothetical protein